jgi:hypothetical protein
MFRIEKIADAIATDDWSYKASDGKTIVAHIEVGRPQPAPTDFSEGDWYCPVFIEGFTPHIIPAMGVGPVDALMNAIILIRTFSGKIGTFAPRASKDEDAEEDWDEV